METITVDNLEQGYGKKIILQNITLHVNSAEILALIGPSGAGKTTLIKTIMGMSVPKHGEVRVLGQEMPKRQLLRQIGFMAQNDALYQELTARENLAFFGQLEAMSKKEISMRIASVAPIVNLEDFLEMPVKDYSGGMKRRLSLAIALLANPKILILDEPTVGIDPELRQKIWLELHRLADLGTTILLTTHVMEDAEESDSLLMIREGEAIAQGTPQALMQQYQVSSIEEVFLQAGRQQDANNRNR